MQEQEQLRFNSYIGRLKPESIINRDTVCPFCDRSQLSDILAEQGKIVWVKNKYPVLEQAFQTVLIETDDCDSDLSEYPRSHLHDLFRFAFEKWLEFEQSGRFRSVLFFKNHGPYSGGTIRHPHMQIVGLERIDYTERAHPRHFDGLLVYKGNGIEFNVSTFPRMGFVEFNILMDDLDAIDAFADATQVAAHYTLHGFHKGCNSYNLFFYHVENRWIVKVMPRFVTSPIFVGYSIPQVSNRIDEVAHEIRKAYYS